MSVKFVRSCLSVVSGRISLLAVLNLLFFGCLFTVVLAAQFMFPPSLYGGWSPAVPDFFLWDGFLMVFGIFLFNLVVAAFIVVTLLGIVFFPLSAAALLYRAVLWGLLIYMTPSWLFLAALPVVVLEGEAYIFAAAAGTVAGASWIKPSWVYRGETLSRTQSLRRGLGECLRFYVFVVLFLLVAAVVETVTILNVLL